VVGDRLGFSEGKDVVGPCVGCNDGECEGELVGTFVGNDVVGV
jgi:hypothetical protein